MALPTIVSNLSTAQYRQYVLQTLDIISGGGGENVGLSNLSTAKFREYVLILLAEIANGGGGGAGHDHGGTAWSSSVNYKAGDIVSLNGVAYVSLTNGNGGHNPTGLAPYWSVVIAEYRASFRSVSGSTTLSSSDSIVLASASSGNVVITLPAASSVTGKVFNIKRTDNSANTVTVSAVSLIDGEPSVQIKNQYTSIAIASNGTAYFVI